MTSFTGAPDVTSKPLISVALCTYNGVAHLDAQLDSILSQQGVRLEVVVLDDASTDDTWALLQTRATADSRIRLFRNATNLGHLRSFEKCMDLAEGEWIAPSDQDDIWAPDKLAKLLAAVGAHDLAYCDSEYMEADGTRTGRSVSNDFDMFSGTNPVPLFFQNTVSGHACLLRKDLLAVAGPAPGGFFHDWWLALIAAGRNGVVYVDERLVYFRRHERSCTTIGRTCGPALRRNRQWLEDLVAAGNTYAQKPLREATAAGQIARAVELSLDGRNQHIWHLIWAHRHLLPPQKTPDWLKAVKLWSRIRRKSRRAMAEPAAA